MGWNDHIGDPEERIIKCPDCGKRFRVWEEEQVPGFREKDYLYCPYCKKQLASSMEVEYNVSKIEE